MPGMTFDIRGLKTTQAEATKLRLARPSAIMCARRSVDNAVVTASISSLTRASYTAQFTAWPTGELTELYTALNRLFRRASGNMPTFPTRLLYLPHAQGGLGLPRLSTYVNLRKWSMAQRALSGLLERAARVSGSPGTLASIGFTALTPTWGGSLGHHCIGSSPIFQQKGLYQSALHAPLSLLLDSRPQRRTLTMLRDRSRVTWSDLTRHAVGRPRPWLPAPINAQMLTFPADPLTNIRPRGRGNTGCSQR